MYTREYPLRAKAASKTRERRMKAQCLLPAWRDVRSGWWWKAKLIKHFLPIGIIVALIWGLVWPAPGSYLYHRRSDGWDVLSTLLISLIFFLQGMSLQTDEVRDSLRRGWPSLLYCTVSILGITGLYGFIMIRVPLTPDEFRIGAALFCVVPTTLTMGVTLVTQANGNSALALLLTAGTNILGVGTTPFLFQAVLQSAGLGVNAKLNPVHLLVKLAVVVLTPCVIGKVLRDLVPPIQRAVDANRVSVGIAVNAFLICIVWMSVSAAQRKFLATPANKVVIAAFVMVALHLVFLVHNWSLSLLFRFSKRDFRCCVILPSQKALPVALTVMSFLPKELGNHGLMAIPPTVAYVAQLLIDSAVVAWWLGQDEKEVEAMRRAEEVREMCDTERGDGSVKGGGDVTLPIGGDVGAGEEGPDVKQTRPEELQELRAVVSATEGDAGDARRGSAK